MTAAEVLAAHQIDQWAQHDGWWGCTCDGDVKCDGQHQLDALRAAGYAVVELPTPDNENSLAWSAFDLYEVSVNRPLLVQIGTDETDWVPGEPVAASVARAYGLALLAAADAAQAQS